MIPDNDYISSDRCRFILGISMVSNVRFLVLTLKKFKKLHTSGTLLDILVADNFICACCPNDSILTKIQT